MRGDCELCGEHFLNCQCGKQNLVCVPPGGEIKLGVHKSIQFIPIPDQIEAYVTSIRNEKRKIARIVYREVNAAIEKWEGYPGKEIRCHWDEYITVDGEGFSYYELVGEY